MKITKSFEIRFSTGEECKTLRENYGLDLEEMNKRYGYPIDVLEQWENHNVAIYPDAMRCLYYNMSIDESTSPLEFAAHEIFNLFPVLKTHKQVQDILDKWEVFEILGEDTEEWMKESIIN